MIYINNLFKILTSIALVAVWSFEGIAQGKEVEEVFPQTEFGGFGELHYQYDLPQNIATATAVVALFEVDHRFNEKIKLHAEVSFEADHFSNFDEFQAQQLRLIDRNDEIEVDLEELYLKFKLTHLLQLRAGLFIMRSGLVAERHDPTTYRSVNMPEAEKQIIPGHWKEIGVELHGKLKDHENIHYSIGLVTGLNAAKFTNGTGIRKGRYGGVNASASNLALTGSLHFYSGYSRFQASVYYGGAIGLSKTVAKEYGLSNGPFGTPVFLPEVNYKFQNERWDIRTVGALLSIPDADKLNNAFDQNIAKTALGGYVEAAYDLLPNSERTLYVFGRLEYLDMNHKRPDNALRNDRLLQRYWVAGINYLPIKNIAFKAEFAFRKTGSENTLLRVPSPFPESTYRPSNGFVNLGMAYSF